VAREHDGSWQAWRGGERSAQLIAQVRSTAGLGVQRIGPKLVELLDGFIAVDADDAVVAEGLETSGLASLGQEHVLAREAPALEVVGVTAVFHEPQ
jgi:hypothetical protein